MKSKTFTGDHHMILTLFQETFTSFSHCTVVEILLAHYSAKGNILNDGEFGILIQDTYMHSAHCETFASL